MSFPRYPKYKPSGVEWLGDVPEGWEVMRARAVGVFSSSGIDKKSVDGEQAVQMFNYLDVYKSPDKILRYSQDLMWTTAPASKVAEHSVVLDDILLTPSSETADDIGHAARVTSVPPNILYSYHILRFRKGAGFDASFVTHCFNAVPIRSYFESVCTGTTRKVLVRDDFKNAPFAIPPLPEQTAIAEFLDRETGKIDELVAEQRRLIELLKEKRQAVISHAVTKGLNPHAPMKPSGIEWLGDVPVGWKIMSVRRCANRIQTGGTPPTADQSYYEDGTVPWFGPGSFDEKITVSEPIKWLNKSAVREGVARVFAAGSTIIVTIGATIGKVSSLAVEGSCNQQITVIEFDQRRVCSRFATYQIKRLEPALRAIAPSATLPIVGLGEIADIDMVLPALSEQIAIVAHLDTELAKFDTLTAEAQRAIDLLQERRTALISAAVTGQIDVRPQTQN